MPRDRDVSEAAQCGRDAPSMRPAAEIEVESRVALEQSDRFVCDACGGDLGYAPALGKLLCAHCGGERVIPRTDAEARDRALEELDYETALTAASRDAGYEEIEAVTCGSCGAEERFEARDRARLCPFCGAALVAEPQTLRRLEPRGVLPFLISEADAMARLAQWLRGRWFAPAGVRRLATPDAVGRAIIRPDHVKADADVGGAALSGVYVPFFTFDARTRTEFDGQRGEAYTEHVWRAAGQGRRERVPVRRMRWRSVSGRVSRAFDDVSAPATAGLDASLLERLDRGGWDLRALEAYDAAYLAGFVAEAPSVDLENGFTRAQQRMATVIDGDIRRAIGGDGQRVRSRRVHYDDVRFRVLLAPVWVARYRHGGKTWQALVNGRTGAVSADAPVDPLRVLLAVGVAVVGLGGLYAILSALGG